MSKEIKTCPFCGKQAELITRGNAFTKSRSAEIVCLPCNVKMTVGAVRSGLDWCCERVITKWNNRI